MPRYSVRDPLTGEEKSLESSSGDPSQIQSSWDSLMNVLSLPKQGVDYLARAAAAGPGRSQGLGADSAYKVPEPLPVSPTANVGQMLRSGVGLNQGDEGLAGHLLGKGVELGTNAGMDPTTWGGLGLSGKVGQIANQALLLQSGRNAAEAAKNAYQQYQGAGSRFTPEVAEGGLDALTQALLFGAAAKVHSANAPEPSPAGAPAELHGGIGIVPTKKAPREIVRESTDQMLGIRNPEPASSAEEANRILQPAKKRLAERELQTPVMQTAVKNLSRAIGTTETPQHLGSGYFHDVYDLGTAKNGREYVMRANRIPLAGQEALPWPKSEHVIQPSLRQQVGDKMIEVIPKVDTSKRASPAQLATLKEAVGREGYSLVDPEGTGGNVAIIGGRPMVVDPGALVPTPVEQAFQAAKAGKAPSAEAGQRAVRLRMAHIGMGLGGGILSARAAQQAQEGPPAPPNLGELE